MPGYYKLREKDAHNLTFLLSEFRPSTHAGYMRMLLYCWSNIQSKGKPCPYFNVGVRQIAEHCEASKKQAERMIKTLEEADLIINLGTETIGRKSGKGKPGTYTKRTFWWLAEEGGVPFSTPEKGTPLAKNAGEKGTHQRASLSREGAKRSPASAGAPAPLGSEEWYEVNGVDMPTPATTSIGG